jgi:hypothetical protein
MIPLKKERVDSLALHEARLIYARNELEFPTASIRGANTSGGPSATEGPPFAST